MGSLCQYLVPKRIYSRFTKDDFQKFHPRRITEIVVVQTILYLDTSCIILDRNGPRSSWAYDFDCPT